MYLFCKFTFPLALSWTRMAGRRDFYCDGRSGVQCIARRTDRTAGPYSRCWSAKNFWEFQLLLFLSCVPTNKQTGGGVRMTCNHRNTPHFRTFLFNSFITSAFHNISLAYITTSLLCTLSNTLYTEFNSFILSDAATTYILI
jgi:hypothetical protein